MFNKESHILLFHEKRFDLDECFCVVMSVVVVLVKRIYEFVFRDWISKSLEKLLVNRLGGWCCSAGS